MRNKLHLLLVISFVLLLIPQVTSGCIPPKGGCETGLCWNGEPSCACALCPISPPTDNYKHEEPRCACLEGHCNNTVWLWSCKDNCTRYGEEWNLTCSGEISKNSTETDVSMGLIKKCPCKPDAPTGNSKIEKCPQCRCESGMCGSYAKMIEEESANIEIEKIGTTLREPNVLMINAYLRNHGKETSKYKVRYALKEPNTGVVLFSGITQGLSLDSGSTEISNWTWNNIAPGEYLVEVDVGKENKSVPIYIGSFGASFPLTNTIYPLIILVMGLLLAYYVWKGMKNKKGGLTIVLLTVLLASVVLLINSPALLNTTNTGEQRYIDLCSLGTQQDSEILYGDTFLLCDGQSARLPGLNVKLIGIGAHPKIETMEDGVNHTKVMVSDAVKINFRNYTLIKTFANGIILNIEDLRTDIMPSTNGEFSVKEFSPVRLHNTRISLMVYRDLDNKAHVAVVFGDAVDVKELKQGLEMHLSSAGKWVALSYLGEKKGMHTFRLYRGDQE